MDFFEGSGLAGTRPTCNGYFVDRMFSLVAEGEVLNVLLQIDLVEGILKLLDARLLRLDGLEENVLEFLFLLMLLVNQISCTRNGC